MAHLFLSNKKTYQSVARGMLLFLSGEFAR